MNITVVDINGVVSCRPDTTWEREDKDFFAPDAVSSLSYTPVLFARISKAGKCIGAKFAGRYYESICYGVLLYVDGNPSGTFFDRTSVLPAATYSRITLEKEDNTFEFRRNGEVVYTVENGSNAAAKIEKAITEASKIVSQRIGDLVAVELEPRRPLAVRGDGETAISGTYCENPLFDFKIVF